MKNNNLTFILLIATLNFCNGQSYFQRIAHFPKITEQEIDSENFPNDATPSEFTTCHHIGKLNFEENYINQNLEKMTNGDKTIIGFRNLRIKYTEYALYGYLGPAGVCCVTYTGYAIRKKEINKQ